MRRFRHLRRLTAAVAQLLLLHLAFIGGAGACMPGETGAQHDGMQMAGMAGMADGQHHLASADAPTVHAAESPASPRHAGSHCDMACAPSSCAFSSHCSTIAPAGDAAAGNPLVASVGRAPATSDAAPRSVSTAPEPPPPRA